jgi:long-chain acyl-CoA synthetase
MTWARLATLPGRAPAGRLAVVAGPWDLARVGDLLAALRAGATALVVPDGTPPAEVARLAALAEPCGPAVLLPTSGSTGLPKLVRRPLSSLEDEGRRYVRGGWALADDRVLVALSPAHAYALGWLFGCLLADAEVAVVAPRAFGAVEAALVGATVLVTTPPLARLLERRAAVSGARAPALRLAMAGAGPVDAAVDGAWRRTFGLSLARNYGSTETGAVLAGPAGLPPRCAGSAMPGVTVEVLDGAVRVVTEDGSVHDLPDLAERDAGGNVTVLGRTRDARARVGGHWVAPLDVEAAARDLPGVVDACAAVLPGPDGDDAVRVDCVTTGAGADAVRAALRAVVSAPVTVRRVRRIRRTPAGKVAAPRDVPGAGVGGAAEALREALARLGDDDEVAADLADLAALAGPHDSAPVDAAALVAAARRGYGGAWRDGDPALAAVAAGYPSAVAGAVHGAAADLTVLGREVVLVDRFLDAAGGDPVATALRWVLAGAGDWWTLDALGQGLTVAGYVVGDVAQPGDGIAVVPAVRP